MLNLKSLLLKFLPGFIPIILFVIADVIWGIKTGLYVAVAFGAIQFFYVLIKHHKTDFFVLADTLLLVILGVISLMLNNDSYFKLKPAMIETIFVILIGISVFSRHNIMMLMSQRYLRDIKLTEVQVKEFKSNLTVTFFIFLVHIVLVVYSAYFMSDEAWAFMSSLLLYLMFGGYLLFQVVRYRLIKNKMKLVEWLPMVDAKGGVKGKIPRSECHGKEKIMHPVVHLHVIKNQSVFLQKRPYDKLIQPGKWDTAVGGHLNYGENIEQGLRREASEEIGLKDFTPRFLVKYVWETDMEKELVYCFICNDHDNITINKEEVDDGKFWPVKQIRENLGKEVFTSNFEKEFEFLECIYFSEV